MSVHQPSYWLTYLSEATERGSDEITAIAPGILDRSRFTADTQILLAAADAYRADHPDQRVVFAAAVTRWLHVERGIHWADLDCDFYDALLDLDRHAPALLIEAAPITRAIVANAALRLELVVVGEGPVRDLPTEPVRAAILEVLERDWPPYISELLASRPSG